MISARSLSGKRLGESQAFAYLCGNFRRGSMEGFLGLCHPFKRHLGKKSGSQGQQNGNLGRHGYR